MIEYRTRLFGALQLPIVQTKVFLSIRIVFHRETLKTVMLRLVRNVEGHVSKEVRGTKGTFLYDGWYRNGTLYHGLVAVHP